MTHHLLGRDEHGSLWKMFCYGFSEEGRRLLQNRKKIERNK